MKIIIENNEDKEIFVIKDKRDMKNLLKWVEYKVTKNFK